MRIMRGFLVFGQEMLAFPRLECGPYRVVWCLDDEYALRDAARSKVHARMLRTVPFSGVPVLGWDPLATRFGAIDPELRGLAAYFLGIGFTQLNRKDQASRLFTIALTDSTTGSLLHKLAAEELGVPKE
jgi:hypothetical protein